MRILLGCVARRGRRGSARSILVSLQPSKPLACALVPTEAIVSAPAGFPVANSRTCAPPKARGIRSYDWSGERIPRRLPEIVCPRAPRALATHLDEP